MARIVLIALLINGVFCQWDPHWTKGRSAFVHLFEWKWQDIANECEGFLKEQGYAAVQISPVQENVIVNGRPWFERYQTISYKLVTRSGSEEDFKDMTRRCNAAGIRIYPDLVINHMTKESEEAETVYGTGGSTAKPSDKHYPQVPFTNQHFHLSCEIEYYKDPVQVRECELDGLKDLDQSQKYVRDKILQLMNKLIGLGVAGFRMDAAKHMWPEDLEYIYKNLDSLSTEYGFQENSRPFIYQEVSSGEYDSVRPRDYTHLGVVTEFQYGVALTKLFGEKKELKLSQTSDWGQNWNFLPSKDALVFVDNHDSQRHKLILNYKNKKAYVMANAFVLAQPYGYARVLSGYDFSDWKQGPPQDENETITSPEFNSDGSCKANGGWLCEHRWPQIANMVQFRNIAEGTDISYYSWQSDYQISFCRGERGFIAFNAGNASAMSARLKTCLPSGIYCDVITGGRNKDGSCTGKSVHVGCNGYANIYIPADDQNGVIAIHVNSLRL